MIAAGPAAAPAEASASWQALGTGVRLVVTDARRLTAARRLLVKDLAAVDAACSRFRPDSKITRLNSATRGEQSSGDFRPPASAGAARDRGGPVTVSPLLAEAIAVALRAARLTGGDVDPTVGGNERGRL